MAYPKNGGQFANWKKLMEKRGISVCKHEDEGGIYSATRDGEIFRNVNLTNLMDLVLEHWFKLK